MSISAGPKIINSGLIVYQDFSNVKKSWLGKPVVNLLNSSNTYHPYMRPYSGLNHAGVTQGSEFPVPEPPHTGLPVYRVSDDAVDTQNVRYAFRFLCGTLIDYDVPHTYSYYIYLPSMYADRWIGTTTASIVQNSTGVDWHGIRGYNATYNYYGAGSIADGIVKIDPSIHDQWQRVQLRFTPTSANQYLDGTGGEPDNGGLDNNRWVAGYYRVNISGAVSGGTPYHLYLSGGQLEPNPYATPFTEEERTNSNAIRNLAGSSSIVINSMTYNSDGSAEFNGTSDYVSFPDVDLGSDPLFTVVMVIKRTDTLLGKGYWGIGGGTFSNGISGYTNVANKIGIDLWGRSTYHTGQDYPLDEWVHVAWVKNATTFTTSTIKIYINGVEAPLTTVVRNNSSLVTLVPTAAIGRISTNVSSYHAPGKIGLFQLYDRDLSANEIKRNFLSVRKRYGL